jgi:hypothetical protein
VASKIIIKIDNSFLPGKIGGRKEVANALERLVVCFLRLYRSLLGSAQGRPKPSQEAVFLFRIYLVCVIMKI